MRNMLLATVSLMTLTIAGSAMAAPAEDAAYNKSNKPIYDSQGKCVRTMWQDGVDPCAPAAPVVVAAPRPPAPVVVAPVVSEEQRTVYFDFNSSKLTTAGTQKLDQLADIINKSTAVFDVVIHGYTDQIGSNSYNDALANKRAAVVKGYLDGKSRLKSTTGDIRGLGKAPTDGKCAAIKKRAEKIDCMGTQRRVEVEFKAQQ